MIGGSSPEENAQHKIEVCFKQVDDSQLFEVNAVGFLVDHDIDNLRPTCKEKAMIGSNGCKGVNDAEYFGTFFLG